MVKTDPCDSRTIYLCYASRYCVTREHYTRFYNMNGPISALSTQLSSQLSIKTFGFSQNQPPKPSSILVSSTRYTNCHMRTNLLGAFRLKEQVLRDSVSPLGE